MYTLISVYDNQIEQNKFEEIMKKNKSSLYGLKAIYFNSLLIGFTFNSEVVSPMLLFSLKFLMLPIFKDRLCDINELNEFLNLGPVVHMHSVHQNITDEKALEILKETTKNNFDAVEYFRKS